MDTRIPLKILSLYSRVNKLLDAIALRKEIPTLSLVPMGEPFPQRAAQKLSFVQITNMTAQKLSFFMNTEVLMILTHWLEEEPELRMLQNLCNHVKARGIITIVVPIIPRTQRINFSKNRFWQLLWYSIDLLVPIDETDALRELESLIDHVQELIIDKQSKQNTDDLLLFTTITSANIGTLGVMFSKQMLENPANLNQILNNLPKIGFVRDTFDLKNVIICVGQERKDDISKFKAIHREFVKINPIIPLKWYIHVDSMESKISSHALILIAKSLKGFNDPKNNRTTTTPPRKIPVAVKNNTPYDLTKRSQGYVTRTPIASQSPTTPFFLISSSSKSHHSAITHPFNKENDPQLVLTLKKFTNIIENDPLHGPIKEIEVYVFDEGGITLGHFGRGTIRSCNDPTLITGLFSAIQTFAHDVIGGKPRYIETDKLKCVFDVRTFQIMANKGKKVKRTITGVALYPATVPNHQAVPHLNYCLDMVQDLLTRGISESECAEVVHQIIESGGLTSAVFPTNAESQQN